MLFKFVKICPLLMMSFLFLTCAGVIQRVPKGVPKKEQKLIQTALEKANKCINENISTDYKGPIPVNTKVDSITIDLLPPKLNIHLTKHFSYQPLRTQTTAEIYQLFKKYLGKKFRKYDVKLYSLNVPIENLVPNYYRANRAAYDTSRLPEVTTRTTMPLKKLRQDNDRYPANGLYNYNIALWHSHGFYYDRLKDRWEWQRPRLFITVEDLLPMSFVIPYVVPMLENAGANVFLPRERDLQTSEVIIDNNSVDDSTHGKYREEPVTQWDTGGSSGFAIGNPPYPANLNPFLSGTFRSCPADTVNSTFIEWIPNIPEDGLYYVSISYHASEDNVPDARYVVYHTGGKTEYIVNQQIGGSTWIYLGQFAFKKGMNPAFGKVVLMNKSDYPGKIVSADAVRFGGGMGNILRGDRTSGYPRFAEAARYYLQYAGMPDTLVYHLHKDSTDYKDDYQSRGEFVNYLKGKPFGPNRNREVEGLGIPMDLSLAFHTDAGIDTSDSTIGTLMIYSIMDANTKTVFPDSMSRLANRDLGDIIQTQIVEDIRQKYRPDWHRRALMDADYSEAYRPNVPSCLLELLSHQNFTDMKYALTPQFRFDVSRAIYKGMLKFLATQYQFDYAVQPLPVSHFHAFFSGSAEVTLRWQPVLDPLEATAKPQYYRVYTSTDDNGFDNGAFVDTTEFVLKNLKKGVIYNFKVTAVNNGGESFPSEILSVCWQRSELFPVLIVNGFDRTSPPEFIHEKNFQGCATFLDPGVADKFSFNCTGTQYDFDPKSKYESNDAPGHGASHANNETRIIPGNTFNYPYIHGAAIKNCGYSFVSCSDEALMDGMVNMKDYRIMDLILGEEKTFTFPGVIPKNNPGLQTNSYYQAFPQKLQRKISAFCSNGGNLYVSGAYVVTDLFKNPNVCKLDSIFAIDVLKINWRADHAALNGKFFAVDSTFLPRFSEFQFNSEWRPDIYAVESPDAIAPIIGKAKTILRYSENRYSAATAYKGDYAVVVFGFPFETIVEEESRNEIMRAVLNYFKK